MAGPDPAFWENFYTRGGMPWDRGEPSPAMRALFTSRHWHWPKPPYPQVEPEAGLGELLVVLRLKS